jgi:ribosome maturation protein Sdo1
MANVLRSVGTLSTEIVKKVKPIANIKLDQHRLQEKVPFDTKTPNKKVDFTA